MDAEIYSDDCLICLVVMLKLQLITKLYHNQHLYLASQSRELEYVDSLIKYGGVVGHVHKHGYLSLSKGFPLSTSHKVVLKEPSEFALSEWYNSLFSTSAT